MSEAVAPRSLRRRSGTLAVIGAYFSPPTAFAYTQKIGWGIAFVLASPLVLLIGGRTGLAFTRYGYVAMLGIAAIVVVVTMITAFRSARAVPDGAPARWYNRWYHYLWIAAATLAFVAVMGSHRGAIFGYEPFRIPSTAMQPTLVPGDFIVADYRAASMADIRRGDIVTYKPVRHPKETWIKRVIGLPGETIVVKGNGVEIDGKPLSEPWATVREPVVEIPVPFERVVLGPDQYFLLGDNRPNSEDSRFTGPVARQAMLGKARAIWFHWMRPAGFDPSRITTLPSTTAR